MDSVLMGAVRELLIWIDKFGIIVDISPNCYHLLKYTKTEMIGTNIKEYLKEESEDIFSEYSHFEVILMNKDGKGSFYDAVTYPLDDSKAIISLLNIQMYKKFEDKEKVYINLLESSKDIIYRYEIKPENRFTYINHTVEDLLGITPLNNYADPNLIFNITHPDDYEIQMKKVNGTLDYSKPSQIRIKNVDGEYIWFEDFVTPIYNDKEELVAISGFVRNIQKRKEIEKKLEELSFYDSLTGLFSCTYYHKKIAKLNKKDIPFGIMVCDLDNLKRTNDSMGHTYGDKLLIKFACILKEVFHNEATLARIGGDEFVVLIESTTKEFMKKKYNKLINSVEHADQCCQSITNSVSIGWAYADSSLGMVEEAFKRADKMMYKNKFEKRK